MAGLRWWLTISCLSWLAVDVIAKSDIGGLEKIAQYLLYMIMFKYTTTEDGKAPAGAPPPPEDRPLTKPRPPGNFWSRNDMPFLPFLPNGKNRAPTGSGMLEFPDWLDATSDLPAYHTLEDADPRKADSARSKGIVWQTDDFEKLAYQVWKQGFGGTIKMDRVRGVNTRPEGDAFSRLLLLLGDRLEYARKLNPPGLENELKLLKALPQTIIDRRKSEFYRYLFRDVNFKFFTKRNKKGQPVDEKNNPISEDNANKLDEKRVPIGHGAVPLPETFTDPDDPTKSWNKLDVSKTLAHPDNRAPLEEALGPPEGKYAYAGKKESQRKRLADNWIKDRFRAWSDNYGSNKDEFNKPPQSKEAIGHRNVIQAWQDVNVHLGKNIC